MATLYSIGFFLRLEGLDAPLFEEWEAKDKFEAALLTFDLLGMGAFDIEIMDEEGNRPDDSGPFSATAMPETVLGVSSEFSLSNIKALINSRWLALAESDWEGQRLTEEDKNTAKENAAKVINAIFKLAFFKSSDDEDGSKDGVLNMCRDLEEYGCWLANIRLAVGSVSESDAPEWLTGRLATAQRGVFTLIWAIYVLGQENSQGQAMSMLLSKKPPKPQFKEGYWVMAENADS